MTLSDGQVRHAAGIAMGSQQGILDPGEILLHLEPVFFLEIDPGRHRAEPIPHWGKRKPKGGIPDVPTFTNPHHYWASEFR